MNKFLNNEDIIKDTMPTNKHPLLKIDKSRKERQRLHLDNHKLCINLIQGYILVDWSIVP